MIVVQFSNKDLKIYSLKQLGRKPDSKRLDFDKQCPVYCDEQLIRETKEILFKTKEWKNYGAISYVWM